MLGTLITKMEDGITMIVYIEFPFNVNGSCCTPSTNSKLYENVDTLEDIELEEDKQIKLDKLVSLIDRGITQCKGSEVPKLFTDLDGNFLTDVILVEIDNDNKSYYAYEEERFIYPIVAGGFDKEVSLIAWVNDNKDKIFVFDIDIKEY